MGQIINRQKYADLILPFVGKNIIKVLTGQRRVGKSCILLQLQKLISEMDENCNIISINKEFEQFKFLKNDEDLSVYVNEKLNADQHNYLFIDEVQDILGFENVLRSLQAQEACDIFITGSNANMLSSELSTYLSGRYIEFHIHSLSYEEFLLFHHLSDSTQSLRQYLTFGGLPYLCNLSLEKEIAFEYLKNVYSTIILKDVVKRESIRNVDFLESLTAYTADNVGNLFSANNISKYLKSQLVNISPLQVINYLKYLQNAYLINKVRRVDINGLKTFEIGDKFYFEDLGLRNCNLGFSIQNDIHKLMENAIYLHFSGLRYEIFTGQQKGGKEVDFVAKKDDNLVYVQSCYLIGNDSTKEREFGNLLSINDNYPKYVVSLDEWTSGGNIGGIRHIHLCEFLRMQSF